MEHSYIEDNALIDRYLTRKLGAAERAAFEEHFLDCRQCLDELKFAESLQSGIRTFAADAASLTEAPARSSFFGWFTGGWWRLAVPAAATLLIVLLPVSVLLRRYRNEAVRVEVASADLRSKYTALQQQLDQTQRGAAVFILSETRGVQTGATQTVPMPRTPQWIVLAIERDVSQFRRYRATLRNNGGQTVWRSDPIEPISPDAIGISFPSSLLVPGDYTIRLEGLAAGGGPELVATLSFRVIPNP
jgi:hypothetical protein